MIFSTQTFEEYVKIMENGGQKTSADQEESTSVARVNLIELENCRR